jgi:hypothetical protein
MRRLMISDSLRPGWFAHHACKVRAGTWIAILATAVCPGQESQQAGFRPEKVPAVDPANREPDARMQMERNAKRAQLQRYEAANAERKRQLEQDSALLLQLASELETELEKAGYGAAEPSTIRKAEMIEKLAHTVKEKMKLTAAAG